VADSEVVSSLENEPVVLDPADDHVDGWIYGERPEPAEGQAQAPKAPGPAVEWYLDPERWDVPLATSGPDSWARVPADDPDPPRVPLPQVEVTGVETGTDEISFRVDRTGVPVLVKASYFPNWRVEGAEGPYRVTPNQMVVIPTDNEVRLSYGTSWIDVLGWLMAIAGFVAVGWLAVDDQRRRDRASTDSAEVRVPVAAGAAGDDPDRMDPADRMDDEDQTDADQKNGAPGGSEDLGGSEADVPDLR
jgi:hypothetical protein